MRHPTKYLRLFLTSLVAAGLLAVMAGTPVHAGQHSTAGLARAIAAQAQHTDDLLAIRGVVGTAVGRSASGDPVVNIYTVRDGVAGLPGTLDGVRVRVVVTGSFFALHHKDGHDKGGGGNGNGEEEVDPTARFDSPVPIGVSSGTIESIVESGIFISCSTGTLGARLSGGGKVYALSNNHVYAEENNAGIGSFIVQPGPADADPVCSDNTPEDTIGTLAAYVELKFDGSDNEVDAAIAEEAGSRSLGTATPPDGYGEPKSQILACDPDPDCDNLMNVNVQKYGRTTGLTKGTISGVNAMVLVGYDGAAQFVGQIVVSGNKGGFIKGGDSGSLLVIDDAGNTDDRKPVGLLFAGTRSGKTAIANRIDLVLDLLADELSPPPTTLTVDGE